MSGESPGPPPEALSPKEFRHELIQSEFRSLLTSSEFKPPTQTDGVVVLSGPSSIEETGQLTSKESEARIQFGVEIIKQIVAEKSGKAVEDLSEEDILAFSPPLILNGETEQLPIMERVAREIGFAQEKTILVDCGPRGASNTKTQFEVTNQDPRFNNSKHLTFVTSDYHVPRVVRTGDKNLDPKIDFEVIGVPHQKSPYNVFRKVRGEVRRIQDYSSRGDISKDPERLIE